MRISNDCAGFFACAPRLAAAALVAAFADHAAMAQARSHVAGREAKPRPYVINLGDYARGDGSDETEAIQRAFDALPPVHWREHVTKNHPGAVLFIPRPRKFYGISKTIKVVEKWNCIIRCETVVWGDRQPVTPTYFRWLGPDDGVMFEFRSCKGMRVENLSMCGMDGSTLTKAIEKHKWKVPQGCRLTKGVTGLWLGPWAGSGFQTSMIVDHLTIRNVAVGIRLGDRKNVSDVRELSFRQTNIGPFSRVGVIARSGNLANVTFETTHTYGGPGAYAAFQIDGGEILILNWTGNSAKLDVDPAGAEVVVNAGGVQIVKAWSEWGGPFLRTNSPAPPEWTPGTYGSVNYPMILEGVRHYNGLWMNRKVRQKQPNPVPLSIIYDRPIPLHLIGCSFWGGVSLGAKSQATIIDQGTVFVDRDAVGFTGEGVTRYGRVIHVGTRHPKNGRILEPYVVDRRSTPGAAPPTKGVWRKGDRILNVDPDPTAPTKAWAGWICIEGGEPGRWAPFGRIETPK